MATGFEQRFVGFVDILGFRSIVARMLDDPQVFRTIRDALKTVARQATYFRKYRTDFNAARRARMRRGGVSFVGDMKLQMTAFSDCYIVSDTRPAWHVLAAVQALGSRLLEEQILTRGGVVVGPAYHKAQVVFGPAVIEAYKLESEVAKYPRILVSEEVREATWGYHNGLCRGRLFRRDMDGCWFVNVLSPPLSDWEALSVPRAESDSRKHLRKLRGKLVSLLKHANRDADHRAKVHWLVSQFNISAREAGCDEIDA